MSEPVKVAVRRPWTEIAEELTKLPTRTPAQIERFQDVTNELLLALGPHKPIISQHARMIRLSA